MCKQLWAHLADFNIWNLPISTLSHNAFNHVFTCLKQKGIVKTLTPTMLFTTFMIRPQFDAVILALGHLRSLMSRQVCVWCLRFIWEKWVDTDVLQMFAIMLCGNRRKKTKTLALSHSTLLRLLFLISLFYMPCK